MKLALAHVWILFSLLTVDVDHEELDSGGGNAVVGLARVGPHVLSTIE